MTPTLRKRHQRTWWFLGFALLLIWGTSMATINKNDKSSPIPKKSNEKSGFFVALVDGNSNKTKVIKIDVSKPIPSPQTLIYLAPSENTSIENSILLGRLDGMGSYSFALDSMTTAFPIKVIRGFDNIHKKEIFSTTLNNQ